MLMLADLKAAAAAGKLAALALGAGVVFAAGMGAAEAWEHRAPWGLAHKLEAARGERDRWHAASDAWSRYGVGMQASFTASEKVRKQEQGQAVAAVSAEAKACALRVAEARRAALAIHTLVNKEPRYDADHCPVRSLLDPGQLRDALGAH